MGELSNARHERFAQELAAGNPADAAYEEAGYRKHRGNAGLKKFRRSAQSGLRSSRKRNRRGSRRWNRRMALLPP